MDVATVARRVARVRHHAYTDFYAPGEVLRIGWALTKEVDRGFPSPNQTAWIVAIPLVFVPTLFITLCYAVSYYLLWYLGRGSERALYWWRDRTFEAPWHHYEPSRPPPAGLPPMLADGPNGKS